MTPRLTILRATRPNATGLSHLIGEDEQIVAESIEASTAKRIVTHWNSHDDLVKALEDLEASLGKGSRTKAFGQNYATHTLTLENEQEIHNARSQAAAVLAKAKAVSA